MKNLKTDICIKCENKEFREKVWNFLKNCGYKEDNTSLWHDYGTSYIWVCPKQSSYYNNVIVRANNDLVKERWTKYISTSNFSEIEQYFKPNLNMENNKLNNVMFLTKGNKDLQEIIENLLFKNGYEWNWIGKRIANWHYNFIVIENNNQLTHCQNQNSKNDYKIYDVATQLGEILKLIENSKIKIPEVHGHKLESCFKDGYVKFGCATISIGMLRDVFHWMNQCGMDTCNRKISKIILNSGKELTKENIEEILNYIDNQK